MRWLWVILVGMFVAGNAAAHGASASPTSGEPKVVRVEMGYVCGWCGGAGYRTNLTIVERSFIMRKLADAENTKKFPKRKERRAITRQEWETLVHSIDAEALRAVPQDGICRPCIDQPDAWVVVEYSDGNKISVHYDPYPGKEPPLVKALKFPELWIFFEHF